MSNYKTNKSHTRPIKWYNSYKTVTVSTQNYKIYKCHKCIIFIQKPIKLVLYDKLPQVVINRYKHSNNSQVFEEQFHFWLKTQIF